MKGGRSIRVGATLAGASVVALLSVSVVSAKAAISVPCTGQSDLVAAINAANSAGGGTINLAAGCTYDLTTVDNSGENGLPVVTTPITVNGKGATIDGTGTVRVFEVDGPGGSLSLENLTVTGGSADIGGGVANFGGTVALDSSQVARNAAILAGGGIASVSVTPTLDPSSSVATLTLHHSSVSGNQQTLPPSQDGNGGLGGGGILNIDGTATLDHSQVNGNTVQGGVGGGIASGDYIGTGRETALDPRPQPGQRQHCPERRRRWHPEPAGHGHAEPQPGRRQHLAERRRHRQWEPGQSDRDSRAKAESHRGQRQHGYGRPQEGKVLPSRQAGSRTGATPSSTRVRSTTTPLPTGSELES